MLIVSQVHEFLQFASGFRRQRSLLDVRIKGQALDTLTHFVSALGRHVLPQLYPAMFDVKRGGMGKGEWREFFTELHAAMRNMFTDETFEKLGMLEQQRVEAEALARGEPQNVAYQLGVDAGRVVVEQRRAQTSTPKTRIQARTVTGWVQQCRE